MIEFESGLPRNALVMGGNWEPMTPSDDFTLSLESRIRVVAAGILATTGVVDTLIFTAGLRKGVDSTPEAEEQHAYLRRSFPNLSAGVRCIEESFGHTTKADAHYTAEIIARKR